MRGLNLLPGSRDSRAWERYQYREVRRQLGLCCKDQAVSSENRPLVAPLFPGSMMFSQMLFAPAGSESHKLPVDSILPQAPDTFDSYYSSFNKPGIDNDLSNSVVIDCAGGTIAMADSTASDDTQPNMVDELTECQIHDLKQQIEVLCDGNPLIDSLVFLQVPAYRSFRKAYRGDLHIRLKQPDWHVFADVFFLYRHCVHVVFINNMRVLDAAYSACDCSIIADNKIDSLRLQALSFCLHRIDCCETLLRPAPSDLRSNAQASHALKRSGILICENNLQAFNGTLLSLIHAGNGMPLEPTESDFTNLFDDVATNPPESRKPVINLAGFVSSTVRGRLADKRIKLIRKTNKLREDPRSFCRDSPNTVIRSIGSVLPVKKAASG